MPPLLPPHPRICEINLRAWLEEISRRDGRRTTLGDVPNEEWDQLRALGFNAVWFMGIWERSPASRSFFQADPDSFPAFDRALPGWTLEDVVGSPYAIRRYIPDARIGDWKSLDQVRAKLHERGMLLFLDFVPNHVALDHPWMGKHPEYFLRGAQENFRQDPAAFFVAENSAGRFEPIAKARDPHFPPWKDVAQMNLFEPAARAALLGELRKISRHADGVRCDMAMLVLNDVFRQTWALLLGGQKSPAREFWADVREALPDLMLLAEVYWGLEQTLLNLGFHFTYDKGFYDSLREANADRVRARLEAGFDLQRRMCRFLENHDEERSATVFGASRLAAVATLLTTAPGMRLFHQGQLEGRKIHLPIPLRCAAPEPEDPFLRDFYSRLLRLTRNDVYQNGAWSLLKPESVGDSTAENLIAYDWRLEATWKLIVANLGAGPTHARVRLGDKIVPGRTYVFFDELHDARYVRGGTELHRQGLYVRLEAGQAHLFDVSPA